MFPFARIVENISAFCTPEPGDVVEADVSGIGTLRNTIADEPDA